MTDLPALDQFTDLTALEQWLSSKNDLEIAEEISHLSPDSAKAITFRLLPRDRAIEVFEFLDPYHQHQVLEGLRGEEFRRVVEDMEPDDRARLVGELPAKVANRVLTGLSPKSRTKTAAILGYPDRSAGRLMTTEAVSLRETMTVSEALAKVRRLGDDAETVYILPVLDDHRILRGVISLRKLVVSDREDRIADLMTTVLHTVHADESQEAAARLMQEADLIVLPVVDSEERFLGIITVDDAMEVIEVEDTEDQAMLGASQPLGRPYLATSAFGLARSRALWLLILIATAALTVNVMQAFEDTLSKVVTLALFIPLLIDTGGNSGSQASTVVTRAIAVGEIRPGDLGRIIWREAAVGLMLGVMLGGAAFLPVFLIFEFDLAIVVSLTLVAICTWSTFVGSMLPLMARRVGVDPAVVSAPLVTTLVDATGLLIYFGMAHLILTI